MQTNEEHIKELNKVVKVTNELRMDKISYMEEEFKKQEKIAKEEEKLRKQEKEN
jgi:hypothetical protein